jgi:hypothetical protein
MVMYGSHPKRGSYAYNLSGILDLVALAAIATRIKAS